MKAEQFITKHRNHIRSLCRDIYFLSADDVFQETCIVLLRLYPELDELHYLKLIHVTTKHQRLKLYRKIKAMKSCDEKQPQMIAAFDKDYKEFRSEILRIGRDDKDFELLEMYLQGYSQIEIAQVKKVSYGYAKIRTRAVRKRVAQKYRSELVG